MPPIRVILFLVMVSATSVKVVCEELPGKSALLKSHCGMLNRFTANFTLKMTKAPPGKELLEIISSEFPGGSISTPTSESVELQSHLLKVNEGMFYRQVRFSMPFDEQWDVEIECDSGVRFDRLNVDSGGRKRGVIHDSPTIRIHSLLEIGLGLKDYRGKPSVLANGAEDLSTQMIFNDKDHFSVSVLDHKVLHRWVFSVSPLLALNSYDVRVENNPVFTIKCYDFRESEGALLPYRMEAEYLNPEFGVIRTEEVEINNWLLDDPANVPAAYSVVYPEGTIIKDLR